uniref:Uncharacterized protein n=1 Tax=Arundo donax TaxID=35708 RepID=A0A0A9GYX6_ARUDO
MDVLPMWSCSGGEVLTWSPSPFRACLEGLLPASSLPGSRKLMHYSVKLFRKLRQK